MSSAPSRPGNRSLSVRVRILTAVLITTTLGMIGAGVVSYVLARQATYEGVRNSLRQENEEIKTVATIAEEGDVGRPIRGPGDLLYVAIQSSVPDPDEANLGLVNGAVAWVPRSDDPFQLTLAEDVELVAAASAIRPGDPVVVHQISTSQHDPIAFISIPIEVTGSTDLGHYVAAVDVRAAMAPVNRTHLTYALVCLFALGLVGLVGYQVAGRLLAPLRTLRRTAQRITDTDLTERIPADQLSSRDEVADLGHTMNAMLDRLSLSFDAQRQMLDDAGHELRTPITIVRGHLELVDPEDAADVTRTRDLAIEELDRMQRLVEELMMLAKAQRPDFVRVETVELSELLLSVLDKVTPLADRRWQLESVPEGLVRLDPQRITQAMVQLVANAVRFTRPGSVIALGAQIADGGARLWVRDDGVGIDPAQQQRIFDRFSRGEQPTARPGDAGAGLGLAIVKAIAEAHRGSYRAQFRARAGLDVHPRPTGRGPRDRDERPARPDRGAG